MDIHDVGTLIWAVIVIIAVISSLMRSARRAVNRPTSTGGTPRPPRPAPPRQVFAPPPVPATPPVAATPPPVPVTVSRTVTPSAANETSPSTPLRTGSIEELRFVTAPPRIVVTTAPPPVAAEPAPIARTVTPSLSRDRGTAPAALFSNRSPIVNAIIALEVLGPPRALREWTSVV